MFSHVQRQPLAFFTRAQTGSLVSRLNRDVVGAQQAITGTCSSGRRNILTLALVLVAMFYLSWQITLIALVLIPLFIFPAGLIGRRLQRLTRERMQLNAEMGSTDDRAVQRGRGDARQAVRAARTRKRTCSRTGRAEVRDIGVVPRCTARSSSSSLTLLASLVTAVVYGLGGTWSSEGTLQDRHLVALAALLAGSTARSPRCPTCRSTS